MADVSNNPTTLSPDHRRAANPTIMRRFHQQGLTSTHLVAALALVAAASLFLLMAGVTIAAASLALVFFMPLILLSSPIWVPLATLFLVCAAVFVCVFCFGVTVVAASAWLYRYVKGFNPPGALRVDYARSRIYDTASHVKDYAKEYGGYLQSKVKDAAPGA